MGGYIIVAGGETLPEGFQGVQASRAELIDCAKCAVIVCDGAEVPRVVRAAGVMINGDSAAVPSERGLSMAFNCTLMAPHGGIFVFAVVGNWAMYLAALAAGSIVGMLLLALLKKKKVSAKKK